MKKHITGLVRTIIQDHVGKGTHIDEDARLPELGLDSLDEIEIIEAIEDGLVMSLDESCFSNAMTVKQVIDEVVRQWERDK